MIRLLKKNRLLVVFTVLVLNACTTVNLYEKVVALPAHEWKSSYKPAFRFTITDTSSAYLVSLVIRHTEKYNFSNIWCKFSFGPEGDSAVSFPPQELVLADNLKGFLKNGAAMDDIYEHRLPLNEKNYIRFPRKGTYVFTLEQVMREDPLKHIINVGLRVEKK